MFILGIILSLMQGQTRVGAVSKATVLTVMLVLIFCRIFVVYVQPRDKGTAIPCATHLYVKRSIIL